MILLLTMELISLLLLLAEDEEKSKTDVERDENMLREYLPLPLLHVKETKEKGRKRIF